MLSLGILKVFSLYAVFGLAENSSEQAVEHSYNFLKKKLEAAGGDNPVAEKQKAKVLLVLEKSYKVLKNPAAKKAYQNQRDTASTEVISDTHPRLGQLCVTSGIITVEQLAEAVDSQIQSGMALGEVLQDMQFITQHELDGLLMGQQLIDSPSAVTDPTAMRLVSLGLISEDMGLIAQMESKSTSRAIKEIMSRHGWVDPSILNAVLG
jgi:hypothetical protein